MQCNPAPSLERGGGAPAFNAASGPKRHARSRKKGTKTPPGVRYAGRPTVLGNPFDTKRFGHKRAVALHRLWLEQRLGALTLERLGFSPAEIEALSRWRTRLEAELPRVVGIDLQCWCPLTTPHCHVENLFRYMRKFRA